MTSISRKWKIALPFALAVAAMGPCRVAAQSSPISVDGLWEIVDGVAFPADFNPPAEYVAAILDQDALAAILAAAPPERPGVVDAGVQMTLPLPDGQFANVAVARTQLMEAALAIQFPEIQTFHFDSVDDIPPLSGHFLFAMGEFNATGQTPGGLLRIEPATTAAGERIYLSFFDRNRMDRRNEFEHVQDEQTSNPDDRGGINDLPPSPPAGPTVQSLDSLQDLPSGPTIGIASIETGDQLRIYRFTATTTGEFYQANGGNDLSVIISLIVRLIALDAVFEPEVGVRLILAANTLDMLFTTPGFPFNNSATPCQLRDANRIVADIVLDPNDYDLGFLFATGSSGGCAWYVVCLTTDNTLHKARGAGDFGSDGLSLGTGLLLHEVGHQLGARHTYSGGAAGCNLANFDGDNADLPSAYEPGSGSTIMSYSGSCGTDNVDLNAPAIGAGQYYHTKSYEQIAENVFNGDGATCGTLVNTGNLPPLVDAGDDYTIPNRTPFTLEGSAIDDQPLTFAWEQFDLAETQRPIDTDDGIGPIIRSVPPTDFADRTIPDIRDLLSGVSNPVLGVNRKGELLPQDDRTVNFRLTARDNQPGGGGVAYDEMVLTTSGDPFFITSPNSGAFEAGCPVPVTWTIGGGDIAATVDISYSTTGGLDADGIRQSFPIPIANGTDNDGAYNMTLPCDTTGAARIKVMASDNIFFDVTDENLTVVNSPPVVALDPVADGEVDDNCAFTVQFSAVVTDQCGVAAADVDVALNKLEPPGYTLGVPTINKVQSNVGQVDVTGSVVVSDILGSPALLEVAITAEDNCGATDFASELVEISDNTPPEITATLDPTTLSPPNHMMHTITASVEVTDNCPGVSFVLSEVTSDEPDNGIGDGDTDGDIQNAALGTPDLSLDLRAERDGGQDGRTYTVTYAATDGSNNITESSPTVTVAHDGKM